MKAEIRKLVLEYYNKWEIKNNNLFRKEILSEHEIIAIDKGSIINLITDFVIDSYINRYTDMMMDALRGGLSEVEYKKKHHTEFTIEHGLSNKIHDFIVRRNLLSPDQIADQIRDIVMWYHKEAQS